MLIIARLVEGDDFANLFAEQPETHVAHSATDHLTDSLELAAYSDHSLRGCEAVEND